MPCGSQHKTSLLSGQRRLMLLSPRTDLRIMGLDIKTMIYFPSRMQGVMEVFLHVLVGTRAPRGIREPLGIDIIRGCLWRVGALV